MEPCAHLPSQNESRNPLLVALFPCFSTKSNKKNLIFEQVKLDDNLAHHIYKVLHQHNIISVIIEGGSQTLQTFIDANAWDEARVFTGNSTFLSGILAPKFQRKAVSKTKIGTDELNLYTND